MKQTANELREKLEELFYDYHIRGCKPGDEHTNMICNQRKKRDVDELFLLIKGEK